MISHSDSTNTHTGKKKNKLKAGPGHENDEITDEYLDEILHKNNLWIELAMQIISNDKILGINTVQDIKDFNSQSLAKQAKKGEQLVSVMPAIKKSFDLMGDDIAELSTENESLKKIGCCDGECQKNLMQSYSNRSMMRKEQI